jgi:hypothetical protein
MAKKIKTRSWDFAGIFISGLCVLHCLAVPLLLFLAPTLSASIFPSEDITHAVLLAFILGVAGIAFVSGFRVHGQWRPVAWMAGGMLIVIYATFFAHSQLGHTWEPVVAIIGSLALVRAHYLNHHCKKCEVDHTEHDHEHTEGHHSHGGSHSHGAGHHHGRK